MVRRNAADFGSFVWPSLFGGDTPVNGKLNSEIRNPPLATSRDLGRIRELIAEC